MVISLFDLKYHLFSLYSFSLTRGLSSLLTEKTKQNFVFCIVLFFTDLWSYITICFTCFGFFWWFFWLLEKYTQSIKYQNFIYFFLIFKGINFLQNISLPNSKSFLTCVFCIFHLFLNSSVILSLLLNH